MQASEIKKDSDERFKLLLILVLGVVIAVFLRQGVLFRSLWIDESVTFWVIKDSLADAWQRAFSFQGQSPLYFCLLWLWKHVAGSSEIALRIPSFIFLAGAFVLIGKLAHKFFAYPAAVVTTLALLTSTRVELMLSARPYAFGFFFAFLSLHALLRWCTTRSLNDWTLLVLATALTMYGHALFALFALVHLLAYFDCKRRGEIPPFYQLTLAWIVALLCFAPGIFQLIGLSSQKDVLEFSELPAILEVVEAYFPKTIVMSLCVTFVLARVMIPGANFLSSAVQRSTWIGLFLWYVVPPVLFYLLCLITGTAVFKSRYYVWQVGALALGYAAFVSCLRPARVQHIAVLVLACGILINALGHGIYDEGWKSAAEKINSLTDNASTPLLVQPGLVESRSLTWLAASDTRDYLAAPLSYYRIERPFELLPLNFDSPAAGQYGRAVLPKGEFLLLAYQAKSEWFDFFDKQGYRRLEVLQDGHDVVLYRYGR